MFIDLNYIFGSEGSLTSILKKLDSDKVDTSLDNFNFDEAGAKLTSAGFTGYVYTLLNKAGANSQEVDSVLNSYGYYEVGAASTATSVKFNKLFFNNINSINIVVNRSDTNVNLVFTNADQAKIFDIAGNNPSSGTFLLESKKIIIFTRTSEVSKGSVVNYSIQELFNTKYLGSSVVNLSSTTTATNVTIDNSSGTNATIAGASNSKAGVMVATDKIKLDGVENGATKTNLIAGDNVTINDGGNGDFTINSTGGGSSKTNLTSSATSTKVTINNDNGTNAVISGASTSDAGVMVSSDKDKLDKIQNGATKNNLIAGTNVTIDDGGNGNFTINANSGSGSGNLIVNKVWDIADNSGFNNVIPQYVGPGSTQSITINIQDSLYSKAFKIGFEIVADPGADSTSFMLECPVPLSGSFNSRVVQMLGNYRTAGPVSVFVAAQAKFSNVVPIRFGKMAYEGTSNQPVNWDTVINKIYLYTIAAS